MKGRSAPQNSASLSSEQVLSATAREKLLQTGIRSLHALLTKIEGAAGARRLAQKAGMSPERMIDLWGLAELRQVHGVGEASAQLLLVSGVRSLEDLSRREAVQP